jgi:hypothetical protein
VNVAPEFAPRLVDIVKNTNISKRIVIEYLKRFQKDGLVNLLYVGKSKRYVIAYPKGIVELNKMIESTSIENVKASQTIVIQEVSPYAITASSAFFNGKLTENELKRMEDLVKSTGVQLANSLSSESSKINEATIIYKLDIKKKS